MTPYEETFIRVTLLLDEPGCEKNRAEIKQHLDTMIEFSSDDTEKRAAYDFKGMALNHIDSIGNDHADLIEEKRVRALKAARVVTIVIEEGKAKRKNGQLPR